MKSGALAGIVALVFVVGVGAGLFLGGRGPTPAPSSPVTAPQGAPPTGGGARGEWAAAPDGAAPRPQDASGAKDAGAPAQGGEGDPGPAAQVSGPSGPPPTPPPAPPPPPQAALAEGERAARGPDPSEPGGGRVKTLVYDFESDEERQAWETRRRESWERRLRREIDIKLETLREKAGLSPSQLEALRQVLDDEHTERMRITDALTAKEISQLTFDEQVQANVARARERMAAILTPAQLEVYQGLKPREQVLREETQ